MCTYRTAVSKLPCAARMCTCTCAHVHIMLMCMCNVHAYQLCACERLCRHAVGAAGVEVATDVRHLLEGLVGLAHTRH